MLSAAWLHESLRRGRLHFTSRAEYSPGDVCLYLEPFEVGGTTLDFVLQSPRKCRLAQSDDLQVNYTHHTHPPSVHIVYTYKSSSSCGWLWLQRTGLLRSYRFVLIEARERVRGDACLTAADVCVLIHRGGGLVAGTVVDGLPDAAGASPESVAAAGEEDTCSEAECGVRGVSGGGWTLGIDLRRPVPLADLKRVIAPAQPLAPPRLDGVFATVSVEWLLDAICNQRVATDLKRFTH